MSGKTLATPSPIGVADIQARCGNMKLSRHPYDASGDPIAGAIGTVVIHGYSGIDKTHYGIC
ncbi:MAG: hypothetical protein AAGC68_01295 [Verrucomicrobiota bacterium]